MNTKRHANQPIVPQVAAETWRALVETTEEFNRLAPWEWMHDSHVIGLRHPVTKEVLLGSILGRLRQVFGLLVYRNDAGRRWLLNAILNDGAPGGLEDEDSAFEQDLVKLEFTPKRELGKEDRAILDTANFSPAVKRGRVWPQFRSLAPGGFPWYLTQTEAETLLFALPRVAAVARMMQAEPHAWDDHCDGQIGFVPDGFDPGAGALRAEQMEWQPMLPPPEPRPEAVSLDDASLAELLQLPPAKGFHLELDVAYANFPVANAERAFFPKLAMAVDRASGFVGGFRLGEFQDRDGAKVLGVVLRDALTQLGRRPESIRVQRPRVEAMVAKVAGELGIQVMRDVALDELNCARESMTQRFNRMA
ncbi:MAG: hypothetical protein KIS67_17960 [Verrucomicrobiae bacterium]|nr:hypothetical protein [Verrucomicrobiae bacterium]